MKAVLMGLALRMAILAAMALPAYAHKPSDSYLTLSIKNPNTPGTLSLIGQWDIALRDLDYAIGLDRNQDNQITWGEIKKSRGEITAYVLPRLYLQTGKKPCSLKSTDLMVDDHTDGTYAVILLIGDCPNRASSLTIDYRLFFDLDPTHRGLLRLTYGEEERTALFSPERATETFDMSPLASAEAGGLFMTFFREGVFHLLTGLDHILFLFSLLLPSVLQRTPFGWEPVSRFRPAFMDLIKIVTSFTLAHSITLTLAVLYSVQLPSRVVESVIAASIIVAAFNNLWPFLGNRRWQVAFGFGLLHGFGFSGVLTDLGLPAGSRLVPLFGFNLGVEAGQMAIVAIFMPWVWLLRSHRVYRRVLLPVGSACILILASFWMVERILG